MAYRIYSHIIGSLISPAAVQNITHQNQLYRLRDTNVKNVFDDIGVNANTVQQALAEYRKGLD